MKNKIENQGIYETLVAQLDRVARHNRQGSIQTKRRYYEAVNRFCAYLADEYHLPKTVQRQRKAPGQLCDPYAGHGQVSQHHQDGSGGHSFLPRQDGCEVPSSGQ